MAEGKMPLTQVEIVRVNLSITEMASFLVRLTIAAVPASIIIAILCLAAFVMFSAALRVLGF